MKISRYSLLLLLALLLAAAPASGAAKYTVTEIVLPAGTDLSLSFSDIFYLDINDNGVVAGWSHIEGWNAEYEAYRWEKGVLTVLPRLQEEDLNTKVYAINNQGQMAGHSGPPYPASACLWLGAAPFTPAALPDGGTTARGINDLGQVVGNGGGIAVLWKDGVRTILPGLSELGNDDAYGINNNGFVVGMSYLPSGRVYPNPSAYAWPTLWRDGVPTCLGDFITYPDQDRGGRAFAINDRNQVVGYAYGDDFTLRAFLWEEGSGLIDLAPDYNSSRALDINNAGQIVGYVKANAVLWEKGAIINLNTRIDPIPGYSLTEAQAINNQGQIVCLARDETWTNTRIYLLTPVSSAAAINLLLLDD